MESLVEVEYLGAGDRIAIARMVREKPLNSLLLDTINQLSAHVFDWLADDNVACIILDSSSERAFCAGADITALYHSIREADGGRNEYAEAFFLNEYRLDYALHTACKPVLAWGNGIVMGGGLGLLGGCSHRVGTPSTRVAMPEITIGLFPDAGGTAFLSRLPDHLGLFAGLTGCQLSAADALELELLDVIVPQESKTAIMDELGRTDWAGSPADNDSRISAILEAHRTAEPVAPNLLPHRDEIRSFLDACLKAPDFFEMFDAGLNDLVTDEWMKGAVETYRAGSPTTARVFLEQMQRAKGMSLADMFRMELVIAYQCARHPDFPEGVRALLVDKDRNPSWRYRNSSEVPESWVAGHFEPTWKGEHPLHDLGQHDPDS